MTRKDVKPFGKIAECKEMPGTTGILQERRNYQKGRRLNGMQTQECTKKKAGCTDGEI